MPNERIKLVHITSSLTIGGAEAILCDLIEYLDADTFEHHVIYFHAGPYIEKLHALGVPTYHIKGLIYRYDPLFFIRLFCLIKKLQPNRIHTLLWAANVAGRLIGYLFTIPVLSVVHNNVNYDGLLRTLLDRCTIMLSNVIVAVSGEVKQSLLQRDMRLSAHTIHIITNGVDHKAVRNYGVRDKKERHELGLSDEHFVIGSVGRLVPVKNYGLLLESFALVHKTYSYTRLVLVGTGPQEHLLNDQARLLGVKNEVLFVIDQPAYGYYALFDCFVQTSLTEGVSRALLEAMSFSLPCIVTSSLKEHSVISDGRDGMVVTADNAQLLAHALMDIMNNTALSKTLGSSAQQTVMQHFSIQKMVQAYETLFKNFHTKI